jgi:hypothetical protein
MLQQDPVFVLQVLESVVRVGVLLLFPVSFDCDVDLFAAVLLQWVDC